MSQEADHNSKAGRTVEEIYAERKRALEQEIRNTKLSPEAKQALGRNSPEEAWFDLVEMVREAAEEYYQAAEQLIPEELYPDSPLACTRLDRLVVSLLSNRPNAPLAINQLVESNPDLDLSHIRSLPVLLPLKAIVKMLLTNAAYCE